MTALDIRVSEVLKTGPHFELKRVFTTTGQELLVKLAVSDHHGDEDKLLEREFELLKGIGPELALRPVRMERLGTRLAAVYEAFDGVPLEPEAGTGPVDLLDVSRLAGDICDILAVLHGRNTILLGVSPGSFLRSPRDHRLVLADAPFARASGSALDTSERYWLDSPYLVYAAPESLRGSSRAVDHRADLYSLGGLLYHLICRQPPFRADDPAELVQWHLAKQPRHLLELVPSVPRDLADPVMRLLAKTPSERFASVEAFEQAIVGHLASSRRHDRTHNIRSERSSAVAISFSTTLHGHQEAANAVRDKIRSARHEPALVFLEGEAGSGKTMLLRAVKRLEAHACFCGGRFNSDGPTMPLSGWVSALVDLANVVLTSPTGELEAQRARILAQLGDWAPLIGALAPEWQAILRCPAPPAHDPLDTSLNRLALAIRRLIGCFGDEDSPVILMLDDLQWADASSLRILEFILTAPEPLGLLVLAAVRNGNGTAGEVAVGRSLAGRLSSAGVSLETVQLRPWTQHDVQGFVTETLEHAIDDPEGLAQLLVAKTRGNPFFVRELVRVLVKQHALRFQPASSTWRWDESTLRRLPVTQNVVEFLSLGIAGLPAAVKDVLRVCACLGKEFRPSELMLVNEDHAIAGEEALQRAVAEGLLIQRDEQRVAVGASGAIASSAQAETTYEFVHDRVLEAARALLSGDESARIHLRIGQVLSRNLGADAEEDRIYKVASHFNLASPLIVEPRDRYACAELNLRAGRLAKLRGAFSQALDFLHAGLAFLDEVSGPWGPEPGAVPQTNEGGAAAGGLALAPIRKAAWLDQFKLTLALHEATAEVALLNGQLALMTRLCDDILARVGSPLLKVLAYEIRICGFKAEKRFSAAVDAALKILGELGIQFPVRPSMPRIALGFLATRRRVFSGPLSRLTELPVMRDDRIKAACRIIQSVYPAAYLGRPKLFPFLVYRHVNDSLAHGNEEYSAVTYIALGVVLSGTGEFERATQLGNIGLGLLRRFNADRLKARAFMAYYSFIFPWQNHIRNTLPYYREGLDSGLAHGDFEYASYIMTLDSLARLHTGELLSDLQPEFERHAAKIKSLGQERSIVLQNMLCQLVLALRLGVESQMSGRFYDEAKELPRCLDPLDENLVFHNYLAKTMSCLFLGDHAAAAEAARRGRVHLGNGGFGNYLSAVFVTYESLAYLLAAGRPRPPASVMRLVKRNLRLLERWSKTAPMNFLHKYHLVEAERCRVLGRVERAAEHFEKAIELSQLHGFLHETGLAQERAAVFYLERDMTRLGRQCLRDCYLSYRRWGAEALTRRLEAAYEQHFAILATHSDGPVKRVAARFSDSLDYRMLLKSSQAISGEILLPRLLERLLRNILEHAGAQRALLVLEKRGELRVAAEADVDRDGIEILGHETVEDSERLCRAVLQFCVRKAATVILADAAREGLFVDDPYVRQHRPKSVLCAPILHQSKLVGVIYLENHRVSHLFNEARCEVVNLLASQAAISIANARFHALELEAQQAKINPHFLFNALSSIADLAVSDGTKAETAIVKLANLYRYILTNSTDKLVALEQELEIVRNYLALEKLRFGDKLAYTVETEGDPARVTLPGLLIQPLVENSIRHGVAPKLTPGMVAVHAAVRGDRCCIVVQDDGDGGKCTTSGTGFGLRSIQERLALAYGQQFSFAISRGGGYRVEIEIPAAW
jgi:predicted ATPase